MIGMSERELIQRWIAWKEREEGPSFSRKKLASNAGMSPTYLSSILTGARNAGTKTIERIASVFGVTVAEFYGGPNENTTLAQSKAPVTERESSQPLDDDEPDRDGPPSSPDTSKETSVAAQSDETGLKFSGESSAGIDNLLSSFGLSFGEPAPRQPEPKSPSPQEMPASEYIPRGERSDELPGEQPIEPKVEPIAYPQWEEPAEEFEDQGEEPSTSPVSDGVPVLFRAPPGPWREWLDGEREAASERIPVLLASGGPMFAVRLEDRGMSPKLEEGSCVIVDPEVQFTEFGGGIGVVARGGRFTIRHVYAVEESLILVPSNHAYYPEVVAAADAQVFRIILSAP
jgi:SOS-response transcriptional repressor LexA